MRVVVVELRLDRAMDRREEERVPRGEARAASYSQSGSEEVLEVEHTAVEGPWKAAVQAAERIPQCLPSLHQLWKKCSLKARTVNDYLLAVIVHYSTDEPEKVMQCCSEHLEMDCWRTVQFV
jgi:hypothetical protein